MTRLSIDLEIANSREFKVSLAQAVTLERLGKFSIPVSTNSSMLRLGELMRAIRCPNVSAMSVTLVEKTYTEYNDSWLKAILPEPERRPLLRDTSVSFRRARSSVSFNALLASCPAAEHLRIDAHDIAFYSYPQDPYPVAPLRTVHFKQCNLLHPSDIANLLEKMKRGRVWSQFEALGLEECSKHVAKECSEALSGKPCSLSPTKFQVEIYVSRSKCRRCSAAN